MSLAAYPSYKSYRSGVSEMIDCSIPSHWKTEKARFLLQFSKGLTITKEDLQETGVPCVHYGEIHSKFGFAVDPQRHKLKCVALEYLKTNCGSLLRKGDFVFADTSEDIEGSGNFTHLDSEVPTFAGYHTVIARPSGRVLARFLAYAFDSVAFRKQVQKAVKGVKVYSISQGLLKNTEIIVPPLPEQTDIAEFLDGKCEKIDDAVQVKEDQISLLGERRKILIQDAVTRGLNPDVQMKNTGIDWIGQIPAHWEVKRLKYLLKERNERSARGEEPLLMVSQRHGLVVRADFHSKAEVSVSNVGNKIVHENDLVFNKLKAHLGVFFKSNIQGLGIVSPDYAVYTPSGDIEDSKYFELLFRHPGYIAQFIVKATGIVEGLIRLYTSDLFDIPVAVPPQSEQASIIAYTKEMSHKLENAISIKEAQIRKLKEYKTSLIDAAVTGKIKVI